MYFDIDLIQIYRGIFSECKARCEKTPNLLNYRQIWKGGKY